MAKKKQDWQVEKHSEKNEILLRYKHNLVAVMFEDRDENGIKYANILLYETRLGNIPPVALGQGMAILTGEYEKYCEEIDRENKKFATELYKQIVEEA